MDYDRDLSYSIDNEGEEVQRKFMNGVYGWMVLGMVLSGVAAYLGANVDSIRNFIFSSRTTLFVIIGIELAMVFGMSFFINKISASTARLFFIVYSLLNGLTLSSVLLIYTGTSVIQIFGISALLFGGMSLYGLKAKSDLTSAGRYLTMGLMGIIIAIVVNLFLGSSRMDWLISMACVIVFTGLTAYDTQKILKMSYHSDGSESYQKFAILGALTLYLDFINIFLSLLRLFGNRR